MASEFDLLKIFYEKMLSTGSTANLARLSIDQRFADTLYDHTGTNLNLDEVRKLADTCLANEWLVHTTLGGQYQNLKLTTQGLGVVRSKIAREERESKRKRLERVSLYVEAHKGLFILLGVCIALATLVWRVFVGYG